MNKITILNNKIFRVELRDLQLLNLLKQELSYRLTGVEYSQAFRSGGWNGWTCLINSKGEIPLGLLPRVRIWLKSREEDFTVEDLSVKTQPTQIIDLYPRLRELNMLPRDYQERMVGITDIASRGIIRACTGAGKSLVTALIAAKLGRPTCIFVITLDLLNQFHQFFSKVFDEKIGYVGNGICDIQRINIVSIWTAAKALEVKNILNDDEVENQEKFEENTKVQVLRCLKDARVFLLDESHVASTMTIKSLMKFLNPEYVYGLSGTPFREDNSDLLIEGLLGQVLINVSASELIDRGYLVQPWIKFVEVPAQKISGTYQTVYKEYIAENETRNTIILQQTKALADKGYKVLVLFKQIKHGDVLAQKFREANFSFGYISGKNTTDERDEVKKYLANGQINIVLASVIWDIGLDEPRFSGLVLAGAGCSDIRARQRIGRCIRPFPGKKIAAVVDFFDQTKFLKKHSQKRKDIYLSEPGFKVLG